MNKLRPHTPDWLSVLRVQLEVVQQCGGIAGASWKVEEARPRRPHTVSFHLHDPVSKPKPCRQKTDRWLAGAGSGELPAKGHGISGVDGIFVFQCMSIYPKML